MKTLEKFNRAYETRWYLSVFILLAIMTTSCTSDDASDKGITDLPAAVTIELTEQTQEDQMGPFAENAMAVFEGKVWSVGGINAYSGGDASSDVWSSTNGVNWISVTSDQFEARTGHTLTVFDNKLWLIGGRSNSGMFLRDVWYSEDGTNWTLATDSGAFLSAAFHSTVVFNGRMYLITDSSGGNVSVWSSTNGADWRNETSTAFPAREKFRSVVFNNEIYVLGGELTTTIYNEIWRSNDGISWTRVNTNSVFSPRYAHTATVYNNKVWVAGGFGTSGPEGNLWYTEDMENWAEYVPIRSDIGLYNHAALNYAGEIWLFGGYEGRPGGSYPMIGKIRSLREIR
ncbi:kelch repeat-containing protein [Flavobacteriaceae bacterium M23B6Z8]